MADVDGLAKREEPLRSVPYLHRVFGDLFRVLTRPSRRCRIRPPAHHSHHPKMNLNSSSSNAVGGPPGHEWCNRTLYLSVYNLTSSYTDKRNEATIVTTSALMFILAAIFFNLNLYSRFTQVSAILNPSIRIFLSTSLSLFLPVMSYLFSEAKNEGAATGETTELSQRARTILMWMLLVELLRKKVEAIGMQAYSGTIERAARIGWLGYLVLFNLRSAGKKALYATLWVFAAAKLVQRFVIMELAKRSFAYGRNPQLLNSYMAQITVPLQDDVAEQRSGRDLLKQCDYIVTGEEDLEKNASPDGYIFPEAIKNGEATTSTPVFVLVLWVLAVLVAAPMEMPFPFPAAAVPLLDAPTFVICLAPGRLRGKNGGERWSTQVNEAYLHGSPSSTRSSAGRSTPWWRLPAAGGEAGGSSPRPPRRALPASRTVVREQEDGVWEEASATRTGGGDWRVASREEEARSQGIWSLPETDDLLGGGGDDGPELRRLCLSFALYKLLRRRLEDFPITDEEARNCHGLIFKGLLCSEEAGDPNAAADAMFQVFNDEVQFLCEYYHSIHPVVLASPFFFLVNYILFPLVVWALCVLTIILCSNGDVRYAFDSFNSDNYVVAVGIVRIAICIMLKIRESRSPMALYSTVDIFITILLFLAFLYEQIWEFIVFLLSNWFLVSLLCSYTRNRRWGQSLMTSRAIRCILWVQSKLSYPNICFKQLSVLWFRRWPSSWLPTVAVPEEAKKMIMECLASNVDRVVPRSNGTLALQNHQLSDDLSSACQGIGVGGLAEAIVTWHIATALLEARHPQQKEQKTQQTQVTGGPHSSRKVATSLSRYCAYLVAFRPELLPDEKDATERVFKETCEELKKEMGCWRYYLSRKAARCDKLLEMADWAPTSALRRGARLGKALITQHEGAAADDDDAAAARERVWKMVADVWTEVVVCAAPTGSEVHVKAHREGLAQGMEFITVLWAVTTHTGISGGPAPAPVPAPPTTLNV
ncbi:hypothetical protein HU200_052459 [Digitaria exilis]|uniref:DUF4220 domain-containing protein n=1 Tax=Digitaria exilis TaxID=1010633 RepID=A0A835E5X0_9POAL|nr:hypothetical protein HU200_052459 [Digitaria exilis]